jgi:hypothetical protein
MSSACTVAAWWCLLTNSGESYGSAEQQWYDTSVTIVDDTSEWAESGLEDLADATGGEL